MKSLVQQFSLGTIAFAMVQIANAQVTITNVVPMTTPEGTEIRVMFNGLPPQPQAYQLNQPARLVLDFPKVKQSVTQSTIPATGNEISSVEVASDDQRSRLTVNLVNPGGLTSRVEGNTFILKVNNAHAAPKKTTVAPPRQGVANIGFQRGAKDEGLVVVDLIGAKTPIDVQQQGTKVVIRLLGNKIPQNLLRRLNTSEFATPVSSIEAHNNGANGIITIHSNGAYEYMAYQAENKLTVSLKRPPVESTLKAPAPRYTGKKISLDFQDIGVRQVLQLLGDFTGTNIVAADNVQGNITLRLKDVPADQALDIILKTKNLDKRRSGNVIWVAPTADLAKAEKEEADAIAQSIKLAPLQTEYIRLNYAKATDLVKLITEGKNSSNNGINTSATSDILGQNSVGSFLSPRGTISADPRTNTLVVSDTSQKIDQLRKMIDLVDIPVKQVMVEARVVRASTSFSKELGVKWGILGVRNSGKFIVGGSDQTLWDVKTTTPGTNNSSPLTTITRPNNLSVDLGVSSSGASKIAFGLLGLDNFMLDLELSALQADGYGEVISTPKVLTADKQKATIKTGQEIPYQTTSTAGGITTVTTAFKEAVLQLDVTPSITPEGKVQMQLQVTNDSLAAYAQNGEAILNKNEVNTNVLVNDGETVVLGGVFEHINQKDQTKVPVLGDLPAVGRLFRKDVKTEDKKELLIFVTPRIVNDTTYRN